MLKKISIIVFAVLIGVFSYFATVKALFEISNSSVRALYHLENVNDTASSSLNLTVAGDAATTTAKFNFGYKFDGTGDYLSGTDSLGFEYNEPFSISFWASSTWPASNDALLGKTPAGGGAPLRGYVVSANSGVAGDIFFKIANTNTILIGVRTSNALSESAWHHVVIRNDGSGTAAGVDIFVDGVATSTTVTSDNLAGNTILSVSNFCIGRVGDNTCDDSAWDYQGEIDDVAVMYYVLATSSISSIWNAGTGNEICLTAGCDDVAATQSTARIIFIN